MSPATADRAAQGYALAHDEGEAFWLLGMLQTVKIGRADTGGGYGLLEIVVPPGLGSPWHVHPEEDEWFYVLDGNLTFYVGETRLDSDDRRVRLRAQGRAAHLHRRRPQPDARAGRVRPHAVRRIPARSRSARARTGTAATSRRTAAGHCETRSDREALRLHHPRPSGTAAGTITRRETRERSAGSERPSQPRVERPAVHAERRLARKRLDAVERVDGGVAVRKHVEQVLRAGGQRVAADAVRRLDVGQPLRRRIPGRRPDSA